MTSLSLDKTGTKLAVYFPYDPKLVELVKLFQGRRWEKPVWTLPLTEEIVKDVEAAFKVHGPVTVDDGLTAHLKNQQGRSNQILHWRQTGAVPELPGDFEFHTPSFEHQKKAVAYSLAREKFGIFMEQGCVAGWTRIYNPLTDSETRIDELAERGGSFPVLSVSKTGELRVAFSTRAFHKGDADLFTVVFKSGRVVSCTKDHAFLGTHGWLHLSDISVGDSLAISPASYSACLSESISESSPLDRLSNDPRWRKIKRGFQQCYSAGFRPGDARPPSEGDTAPASSPSRGDAPGHGCAASEKGVLGNKPDGSLVYPEQLRPATRDYFHRVYPSLDTEYRIGAQRSTMTECGTQESSQPSRPTPLLSAAQSRFFLSEGTISGDQVSQEPPLIEYDTVVSITHLGLYPFYDMHVPYFESYVAEGIVHHNTGKTKVMLDLLHYFKKKSSNLPALVVCPVTVISAWKSQAAEFTPGLRLGVCRGTPKQRDQILAEAEHGKLDILLMNYEMLYPCLATLKKIKFGTMILDECQKIKHRGTQQAKAAMKIGEGVGRRYILTGTPMANSPLDIFNQIRFLDPTIFGHSWYGYRDRYAIMGGYGGYQQLGWKNLEELTTKLAGISYRVLKKDCLDLPEKTYQEIRLEMGEEQRKCYKELADDLVTTVKGATIATPVVLAKMAKLRQLASGFIYGPDGEMLTLKENPKIVQLREILGETTKDHKVVIWTSFNAEMKAIKELCTEMKLEYVALDGSVSPEDRGTRIQAFQETETVRVFIGQQHAGGVGITLTAADYCVFFSNDYSYEVRVQAEDRLHRIGQKNRVVYIDLIMKGSVEGVIKRALLKKTDLAARITPSNVAELLFDKEDL